MDTARLVWQGGMPMMRHLFCRALVLGVIVVCSTGCECLHSQLRHMDNDEVSKKAGTDDPSTAKAVESDGSKIKSVDSDDKDPQPFFKRNRPSSSFSSYSPEAREIERDLGVY
jgi:hypothetical protein